MQKGRKRNSPEILTPVPSERETTGFRLYPVQPEISVFSEWEWGSKWHARSGRTQTLLEERKEGFTLLRGQTPRSL